MRYLFASLAVIILSGCGEQTSSPQENEIVSSEDNRTIIESDETTFELSDSLKIYYANSLDKNTTALKASLYQTIKRSTFLTYTQVYDILDLSNKDLSSRDEENVILFYTQNIVPADDKCHTISPDGCWNREHLWPKSLGVGYDDTIASYTDLHHIQPADANVNMDRSNRRFASSTTEYSKIDGFFYDDTEWTWEVSDRLKGDVARAILYMIVRYEGENGEPDLELYPNDTSQERPGDLCEMLEWNRLDKVSYSEIRRNETIYQYQKNRNPFIDNNLWVDMIWAQECTQ